MVCAVACNSAVFCISDVSQNNNFRTPACIAKGNSLALLGLATNAIIFEHGAERRSRAGARFLLTCAGLLASWHVLSPPIRKADSSRSAHHQRVVPHTPLKKKLNSLATFKGMSGDINFRCFQLGLAFRLLRLHHGAFLARGPKHDLRSPVSSKLHRRIFLCPKSATSSSPAFDLRN